MDCVAVLCWVNKPSKHNILLIDRMFHISHLRENSRRHKVNCYMKSHAQFLPIFCTHLGPRWGSARHPSSGISFVFVSAINTEFIYYTIYTKWAERVNFWAVCLGLGFVWFVTFGCEPRIIHNGVRARRYIASPHSIYTH